MATAIAPLPTTLIDRPGPSELDVIARLIHEIRDGRTAQFTGLDWDDYEHLVQVRDESGRRVSINFDSGRLELVSHSNFHELWKSQIGAFILVMCEELQVPCRALGETTVKRADLKRGFEPDVWYYLGEVATRMLGITTTRKLDFAKDPPPSLAVEIEVSRSMDARIPLHATLGIPEIWRFDGASLKVLHLQSNGLYREQSVSQYFPQVPLPEILRHVGLAGTADDVAIIRQFREYLRTLPRP